MQRVNALKTTLRARFKILDFLGLVVGTAEDVYRYDVEHCVRESDLVVAICDYPAIGLGWEMCERVKQGKPLLGIAHEQTRVTRLALGAAAIHPHFTFERYTNLNKDAPKLIEAKFEAISAQLSLLA